MRYEYMCRSCEEVFEIEKSISDPHPEDCPCCNKKKTVERHFGPNSVPNVVHKGRPTWSYNDCIGYKTATHNGTTVKIDPSKHGGLKSAGLPGEVVKKKPKKKTRRKS
jgi:putative FmdB family regulatory protein